VSTTPPLPRKPSLFQRGRARWDAGSGMTKVNMAVMLVVIVILLIIVVHYSACNLLKLFGWEKMGGYEAENEGASKREQMSHDWDLLQSDLAEKMKCERNSVTEGMYAGMSERMSEPMYGGVQDYHAGCMPHYAFRGSHDYNLVDYKPPHLINMYPSRHMYVNAI